MSGSLTFQIPLFLLIYMYCQLPHWLNKPPKSTQNSLWGIVTDIHVLTTVQLTKQTHCCIVPLHCLGAQNIACKIITPLKIKGGGEKYSGSHYLALHRQLVFTFPPPLPFDQRKRKDPSPPHTHTTPNIITCLLSIFLHPSHPSSLPQVLRFVNVQLIYQAVSTGGNVFGRFQNIKNLTVENS